MISFAVRLRTRTGPSVGAIQRNSSSCIAQLFGQFVRLPTGQVKTVLARNFVRA
jgi:hypothetical protein